MSTYYLSDFYSATNSPDIRIEAAIEKLKAISVDRGLGLSNTLVIDSDVVHFTKPLPEIRHAQIVLSGSGFGRRATHVTIQPDDDATPLIRYNGNYGCGIMNLRIIPRATDRPQEIIRLESPSSCRFSDLEIRCNDKTMGNYFTGVRMMRPATYGQGAESNVFASINMYGMGTCFEGFGDNNTWYDLDLGLATEGTAFRGTVMSNISVNNVSVQQGLHVLLCEGSIPTTMGNGSGAAFSNIRYEQGVDYGQPAFVYRTQKPRSPRGILRHTQEYISMHGIRISARDRSVDLRNCLKYWVPAEANFFRGEVSFLTLEQQRNMEVDAGKELFEPFTDVTPEPEIGSNG